MKAVTYEHHTNGTRFEQVGTDAYLNNGFQNVVDENADYNAMLSAVRASLPYKPVGHIDYD